MACSLMFYGKCYFTCRSSCNLYKWWGSNMDKRRVWRCMAYISVHTKFADIERREERQLHYIREYAKANRIEIAGVVYRHGLGNTK